MDPEVLGAPYDFYAALREHAPVHPTPYGFWLISRYDDVLAVVRDPTRFSSQMLGPFAAQPSPEVAEVLKDAYPGVPTLLTNDPPSHTRFRNLVNKAFSPKRVGQMEGHILRIAEELVDAFVADGEVELVSQFAVPLPLTVIADALGVDRADMPAFKRWSDDSVAPLSGLLTEERKVECARSRVEISATWWRASRSDEPSGATTCCRILCTPASTPRSPSPMAPRPPRAREGRATAPVSSSPSPSC